MSVYSKTVLWYSDTCLVSLVPSLGMWLLLSGHYKYSQSSGTNVIATYLETSFTVHCISSL